MDSDKGNIPGRRLPLSVKYCTFACNSFINSENRVIMKTVSTQKAPAAIGPYSQAIKTGNLVFVSGQLPVDPSTGNFAGEDIKSLTRQSLENIKSILSAAGTDMAHVVKTTVFLADMSDFAAMNEVYSEYFTVPFPARSAVAVKTLPKNARVEIECIAETI